VGAGQIELSRGHRAPHWFQLYDSYADMPPNGAPPRPRPTDGSGAAEMPIRSAGGTAVQTAERARRDLDS
jgi:hypothetical protein